VSRRRSRPDGELWAKIAATVTPLPGRLAGEPAEVARSPAEAPAPVRRRPTPPNRTRSETLAPRAIEPGRLRRIARGALHLEARLDLHGMDQARGHASLAEFILRAHADGARAVLVITGKGVRGDGILRRAVPEWLSEPPLRGMVAGIATASRKDGGEGALYVTLRRPALPRSPQS